MASWLFSSAAPNIDEQILKATSENLPTGAQDLALNLEICDLIRSKTVPAKDAMRSLKRRLLHKNPNVQLATLHLVDVCIMNGGIHFLIEIASREFMDTVVLVLKPPQAQPNFDVKNLILECVQNWALAFQGQLQLDYVEKIYKQLKDEGYKFPPPKKNLNSSFIDSAAPPEWVDSDTCMKSGTPFSFVNRKHHCRNCGGVFIQKYCNNYIPLPHYGINQPVRVCDDCQTKLKHSKKGGSSKRGKNDVLAISSPIIGDEEDEDLKRALALSLQEGKPGFASNQRNNPLPPTPASNQPTVINGSSSNQDDQFDEDMKAAIAASLAEVKNIHTSNSGPTTGVERNSYMATNPVSSNDTGYQRSNWELSQIEFDNINMYSTLVEKMQMAPPGTILREGKLQDLNENIGSLRPKLARTLADVVTKYDKLVDMNSKLTTAMRYYDRLLEDRLSFAYGRYSISGPPQVNTAPQGYQGYGSQYRQNVPVQPQTSGQYQAPPVNQYPPAPAAPMQTHPGNYQYATNTPASPQQQFKSPLSPNMIPSAPSAPSAPMVSSGPVYSPLSAYGSQTSGSYSGPSAPGAPLHAESPAHTGASAPPSSSTFSTGSAPPPVMSATSASFYNRGAEPTGEASGSAPTAPPYTLPEQNYGSQAVVPGVNPAGSHSQPVAVAKDETPLIEL